MKYIHSPKCTYVSLFYTLYIKVQRNLLRSQVMEVSLQLHTLQPNLFYTLQQIKQKLSNVLSIIISLTNIQHLFITGMRVSYLSTLVVEYLCMYSRTIINLREQYRVLHIRQGVVSTRNCRSTVCRCYLSCYLISYALSQQSS